MMSLLSKKLKNKQAVDFVSKLTSAKIYENSKAEHDLLPINLIANVVHKSEQHIVVFTREISKRRALKVIHFCKTTKKNPVAEIKVYPQGIDKTHGIILGLHLKFKA